MNQRKNGLTPAHGANQMRGQQAGQPHQPGIMQPQQTKIAGSQQPQAGHTPRRPVAPPVYRPSVPKIVQPNANSQTGVVQPYIIESVLALGAVAAGAWYFRDRLFGQPQQPQQQQPQPQPQQQLQQQQPLQNPVAPTNLRANFLAGLQARPQRAQEQPVHNGKIQILLSSAPAQRARLSYQNR